MAREGVRAGFETLFHWGGREIEEASTRTIVQEGTRGTERAVIDLTSGYTESLDRDALQTLSRGANHSVAETATRDTVEMATRAAEHPNIHPVTNPVHIHSSPGMFTRNTLMGTAVVVPAIATSGVGVFYGIQGYYDARERFDNLGSGVVKRLDDLGDGLKNVAKGLASLPESILKLLKDFHIPNPSDIETAALSAAHSAHDVASGFFNPSPESILTIGGVLVGAVVIYEVYTHL